VADVEEARDRADQVMTDIKRTTITASGRTVGLPDLRAGSVLTIEGVGQRFSGRYLVTGTQHQLSTSGYTTAFDCRREEL
jgi:phage protein D